MATALGGSQIKLSSGQVVQAQTGGWYDGQQFWNGSLSQPGQIHPQSDQQGAGQNVSDEVIAQTDPKNVAFIQQRRQETQSQAPSPSAPFGAQFGSSSPSPGAGSDFPDTSAQSSFNLPELYKSLTASSGISEIEAELSEKEKAFTEATGVINDNPFLSEATRVGRVAKLDKLFQDRTANLRDDIATKKADVETQLNLATAQFDINSQQTQLAWQQFNTLLSLGALDGASGEDIASITRSTGISRNMIISAINANKKKNVNSSVIQSTADSGEVTVTVINADTGEIINQQSLGLIGNRQTGNGDSDGTASPKAVKLAAGQAASSGKTYSDMLAFFVQYGLNPKDIYNIYTVANYYGRPPDNVDKETGLFKPQ